MGSSAGLKDVYLDLLLRVTSSLSTIVWSVVVGFRVPADPQGSNSGVHAKITPPAYPRLVASQGSKLHEEQHKGHEVYTSSGHHCGVIPYSSLWCGGLPQGLMMNNTKEELPREGRSSCGCDASWEGLNPDPLYCGG